jgi:hypothetical protein
MWAIQILKSSEDSPVRCFATLHHSGFGTNIQQQFPIFQTALALPDEKIQSRAFCLSATP